jgi:lipopolysaccharide/colanic/teichoic acid biosynthesis glycosyltransferase
MVYQTLCNWLSGKMGPSGSELHPADRFRLILDCERMRADRSGNSFSLVVFNHSGKAANADQWNQFIQHVLERVRATDHAGHLELRKMGVALWDTNAEGAWKFAEQVVKTWKGSLVVTCNVYTYPGLDIPSDGVPRERYAGIEKAAEIGQKAVTTSRSAAVAEPLEGLFVQRLGFWKRSIDVAGAGLGILLLSPLLIVTALLIKLTSKGPVFFMQPRNGLGGQPFDVYKFRTMIVDAEAQQVALRMFSHQDGPAFKMKNDPRVTSIGRFLRKSCIDELPQLINVLKGEMSLVGPRPMYCKETAQIDQWQRRRLDVTPGLTCIWQVYGKSRVTFTEWMRMDIRYLLKRSIVQDIKLIFSTAVKVISYKVAH